MLAQTHTLVPKEFFHSSDWLMRSELVYFAHSLISGLNEGAVPLRGYKATALVFRDS